MMADVGMGEASAPVEVDIGRHLARTLGRQLSAKGKKRNGQSSKLWGSN